MCLFSNRNLGNSLLSTFSKPKEGKEKHLTFIRVKTCKVFFRLFCVYFFRICLKLVFLFVTAACVGASKKGPVATAVPIGGVQDNENCKHSLSGCLNKSIAQGPSPFYRNQQKMRRRKFFMICFFIKMVNRNNIRMTSFLIFYPLQLYPFEVIVPPTIDI